MADNSGKAEEQTPGWRLQAESTAARVSGWQKWLDDQIAWAVRDLHLIPRQRERIHEALAEALLSAWRSGPASGPRPPVLFRIWSSDTDVEGGAWGFFIVERQGFEPSAPVAEVTCVVELFLYQERHRQS
jgi:hypothetical protein